MASIANLCFTGFSSYFLFLIKKKKSLFKTTIVLTQVIQKQEHNIIVFFPLLDDRGIIGEIYWKDLMAKQRDNTF